MHQYNITDILPLQVAHLPLLSSLFTVVFTYLKKAYSTYFPTVMHKNLNTINQLAIAMSINMPTSLTLTMMTGLALSPFQKSRSTPN